MRRRIAPLWLVVVGLVLLGCTSTDDDHNLAQALAPSQTAEPFEADVVVISPDGLLRVELGTDDAGRPRYRSIRTSSVGDESPVIEDSTLGLELTIGAAAISFRAGGELEMVSGPDLVTDRFSLPTGKARASEIQASQATVAFDTGEQADLLIDIWVSNTGLALRYGLDAVDEWPATARIEWERTSLSFPDGSTTWLQPRDAPGFVTPAHERIWSREAPIDSPGAARFGWNFPVLVQSGPSWTLVTESALGPGDAGSHLSSVTDEGEFLLDFADGAEGNGLGDVQPVVELPWRSPWRIAMNSPELGDIVESNLVRHLSPDSTIESDWVVPGRVSWSWLTDHSSSRDADMIEPFIDLAARMGWEYSLVDANWTEFPEGRLEQLIDYAADQDVKLMLWYNSGGPNNVVTEAPRDRTFDAGIRRAEFARLAELGIAGIKVDFFHSDKPESIARYRGILADAAEAGLLANFHGSTLPRGWSREFPNLMTMEAVRGAEIYTFDQGYAAAAPRQNTVLPFTRNVVGSMDYTPVLLGDTVRRLTTNGHELALAVVFESSLQHFADTPTAYLEQPPEVIELLSTVPAVWDETQFLEGLPESHVAIARRHGGDWWVGAISAQGEEVSVTVNVDDLSGLPTDASIEALIVCDNARWEGEPGRASTWNDPSQYDISSGSVGRQFVLTLVENGGCLVRLRPIAS